MAVVALAAWRHEIRPAFLDPPVALARSALALLGIPAGVAVFTAEVDTSPDAKIASLCLEARAVEGEGLARRIYPEVGRRCPAPAPRLWVRGEDIALSRFAVGMRSPRALAGGLAPTRYALLWTESRVRYGSGARSDRIVALLRWRADGEGGVFVSWKPDERTLQQHWPAVGER